MNSRPKSSYSLSVFDRNLPQHQLAASLAVSPTQRHTTPMPGLTYNQHLGPAKEAHEDDPA